MYVFKNKSPAELIAMGIAPIKSTYWIERSSIAREEAEAQSPGTSAPKLSKRQAKKVEQLHVFVSKRQIFRQPRT